MEEAAARETFDLLGTSPELLRTVIDSALAAVVVMNDDGVIAGWGKRAEDVFGFRRDEALGKPLVDLIVPPQYRDAHNRGLEKYRESGHGAVLGRVVELSALHADGTEFPAEIAISPAARVGERTIFIAFLRDISERKESERRQDELYSYAVEATRALRDFANLAVHELRNPLAVAAGYATMLGDGSLGPPSELWLEPLEVVQQKILEASRLVDDLLVTSRAEAGALEPRLEDVDLAAVVNSSVAKAQARARVAGATVEACGAVTGVVVRADRDMCVKIVDNLINNALAHAGNGVAITAEAVSAPAPGVVVTDDGVGIDPALRDRIFERFVGRREGSVTPGSGLGLYLSRQLAEMQNAGLNLDAPGPEAGASFRLSFPVPGC